MVHPVLFSALIAIVLLLTRVVNGQIPCLLENSNRVQLNNTGIFSSVPGSGRVEICNCVSNTSCFWQTVSTGNRTVPFSWKNSIVVCRELGYFDVQSPIFQNTVATVSDLMEIHPTTFICDGTESSLSDCMPGAGTGSQTHQSDAYISCQTTVSANKVRLTGTVSANQGVVEYYRSLSSEWVTICPTSWSNTLANIVCTSLGYESGTIDLYSRSSFKGPEINTIPSILSVSCLANSFFSSCTVTQSSSCSNSNRLAGVICTMNNTVLDGSVRLYELSTTDTYSRVEVYYNGRWGTVCDSMWDVNDGQAACRELGRSASNAEVPATSVFFNSLSSRPIWVSGYNCLGNESSLSACPRPLSFPIGLVSAVCTHSIDAGLHCGESSTTGGISSGAITGIVFFLIFAVIFVGFVVVWLKSYFKYSDNSFCNWCCDQVECLWEGITSCDCDCDCIDCDCIDCDFRQSPSRPTNSNRREVELNLDHLAIETQPRRSRGSSSSDSSSSPGSSLSSSAVAGRTTSPNLPEAESKEFTAAAPPSYNDALRLKHVKPPPEYNPISDKEDRKLPYPVMSDFNPAYPPPLSGADYDEGHPAPSPQPPPPGFLPELAISESNTISAGSSSDQDPPYPDD